LGKFLAIKILSIRIAKVLDISIIQKPLFQFLSRVHTAVVEIIGSQSPIETYVYIKMRLSIVTILVFLAPVYAMPAELYSRDSGLCGQIGEKCSGSDKECCIKDVGIAACKGGVVHFSSCPEACEATLNGPVKCVKTPRRNVLGGEGE
jgi:hypothetical protein